MILMDLHGMMMNSSCQRVLHAVHGNLNPLSRAAEAALEAHRLQDMCLMIQGAQYVHEENRPFNIDAVAKARLRLRYKPTLAF